jgi:hypothetical protein
MPAKQLADLFFPANRIELLNNGESYNPRQYAVQGQPSIFPPPPITYETLKKEFVFISYHKAYLGGVCRAIRLFGINPRNLRVQKIDYGRRLQWALIELTQDARSVRIAGEDYQPYIVIDYEYDHPTLVHYRFGIARMACSNGILVGLNFFANQKVKTNEFKICDPFYNPCLIEVLVTRYELLFEAMKKLHVSDEQVKKLFELMLGRKLAPSRLYEAQTINANHEEQSELDYFQFLSKEYREMGNNMFRVLNMFTDFATHYGVKGVDENHEISREVVKRQQRAGEFLDLLFEYLDTSGYFIVDENEKSTNFGIRGINSDSKVDINSIINALEKK